MMNSFSEQVLDLAKRIPKGKVATYADIARALRRPKAARAVGTALRKNSNPIIIPCHRVVRSDGLVGRYSGRNGKSELLVSEGVKVVDGRVDLARFRASLQAHKLEKSCY